MKILYMISTIHVTAGNGGHYYSLRTTAEEISNRLDCVIIVIGKKESPVFNQSKTKVYNLLYEKINVIRILKDIRNIVQVEKPDVIHTFDENAFFFGNLSSVIFKKPYIHTKCGGGNPRIPFPKVDNLILYSKENETFFRNSKRFNKTDIFYIPNRVRGVYQDLDRINNIKSVLNEKSNKFLIISRINESKKNAILQTINLVNRLNSDGIKSELIIIGVIQDQNVYAEVSIHLNKDIHIFTSDVYTINASQLIDVADVVVGSGRSFMEAASRGKIMLCPLKDSKYPLLIDNDNFYDAFDKNFSDRLSLSKLCPDESYIKITQVLTDPNYRNNVSEFVKYVSKEYFEINSQLDRYCEIYAKLGLNNCFNPVDMLVILYRIGIGVR